jgi:DnaJ-domain-containing protein 1
VRWLEFAVVVGCGLIGFMIINAVIDHRRAKTQRQESDRNESRSSHRQGAAREESQNDPGAQRQNAPRLWWEVLNVDRDATADQIKGAFRREISKYHPDRVEGLGVELRELADRRSKEVNRAYTIAKEQRGFS